MASRKPLVIISGQTQELPSGDTLNAPVSEVDVVTKINANVSAIVKGTPVYVSSATQVDKAQANAAGTKNVLGLVAQASIAAAGSGVIQTDGILTCTTGEWDAVAGTTGGLTAGTLYYLSDATAGQITSTAPSGAGKYIAPIGLALSPTELDISIRGTVLLS